MKINFQANGVESCNEEKKDRRKIYYPRRTKEKKKIQERRNK